MTDKDKIEFAQVLKLITINCGKAYTKDEMKVWFRLLLSYDINDIKSAVSKHIQVSPFPPKMCDYVRLIEGDKKVDYEIESSEQLEIVLSSISRVGRYTPVLFANPYTQSALRDLGGWTSLCSKEDEEMMWFRKNFIETYKQHRSNNQKSYDPFKSFLGETKNYKLVGKQSEEDLLALESRNEIGNNQFFELDCSSNLVNK